MHTRRFHSSIFGASLRPQSASLAILLTLLFFLLGLLLVILTAQPAQAQTFKVIYNFTGGNDGSTPMDSRLIFDETGNLYGTTTYGGAHGAGTVYKLTTHPDGSWTESVLHPFTGGDGANPWAGVVPDATGNLYGTTIDGGAHGSGVVYKLAPNPDGTWTETVLYSFTGGSDGSTPYAAVILDSQDNLYGTTCYGGSYGMGTVYKVAPNPDGTWTQSVIHTFTGGNDGSHPCHHNSLIFDTAGNLYGATWDGGAGGKGVVYKLTPMSGGQWEESVLYAFAGNPGQYLDCSLTFDASGNLYGTTAGDTIYQCANDTWGCGTVFRLTPAAGQWTYSALYIFKGKLDAYNPSTVFFDTAGNLFGTNWRGGPFDSGLVYELKPARDGTWTFSVLHQFTGAIDGGRPSQLLVDASGNVYGTANYDGKYGAGVVYEITPGVNPSAL